VFSLGNHCNLGNTPNMHEYRPNPWGKYIPTIDPITKEPRELTWSELKTKPLDTHG